ncbi:MAG: polymerase subunit epsilon [Bacteroidetes bacterium]|nr:polymerase subunit epsilon [Bacteroidota bacterium]
MFDFVAIDFETADKHNPCSLGIAVVENSQVVLVKQWLIKPICFPYFHYYAQKVHGIKKEDVMYEPEFEELWDEIKPYLLGKQIIAHNASFDLTVLRKTLKDYRIEVPQFYYYCSCQIARKVWVENTKSSLDFLCNQEGIELEHHRADSDARACAMIFLREMELLEVGDFNELREKHKISGKKLLTHLR